MSDDPVELDSRRGLTEQRATGIRRALAEVEANAATLRDRQSALELQLLAAPAASWAEAAAKARYVLNLYAAQLGAGDTQHRNLVDAVLTDFARLGSES